MILGSIIGKTTTLGFKFNVEGNARKFQYVQVGHEGDFILAQIMEIEKDSSGATAQCSIIGRREKNMLKPLDTPPEPGAAVEPAEDDFIRQTLCLEKNEGAFLGTLNGRSAINVHLDLGKLLSKHVVILAKTGAGKSYVTGVLLEEVLDKNIPVLILDPHGEYSTLKYPNNEARESLEKHGLKPKPYNVQEYAPNVQDVPTAKALKLSNRDLTAQDLMHLLPSKLSNAQLSVLYSALKNMKGAVNFHDLIMELEMEESNVKYGIINIIEYLQKMNLFSEASTRLSELVIPGKATIINLKGVPQDVQEIIAYKLTHDLFQARKKGNIPPFFFVFEEAQNYCPERTFGESKSSGIIRQIASEGRKFGISIAVISQRPSRVDKNVISQAATQIILKITNPNDVKAVENSVEGLTTETQKEIRNIPIGTAMVTGIADLPLFVDVRPRKSKHGGESVNVITQGIITEEKEEDEEVEQYEGELLPVVKPHTTLQDLRLMNDEVEYKTILIPCLSLIVSQGGEEFPLLINLTNNEFVQDIETGKGTLLQLPNLDLSPSQRRVFDIALRYKEFKPAELFSKSGLQFSEIYDIINTLANKGLFNKKGDSYSVSRSLEKFKEIKQLACYENVDYAKIQSDRKFSAQTDPNEMINLLTRFVTIKNEKECWLVRYMPETPLEN